MTKQTLTVSDVARYLGFSRGHVSRNWAAWGLKPIPISSPARPRFDLADVERLKRDGALAARVVAEPPVASYTLEELQRLATEAVEREEGRRP